MRILLLLILSVLPFGCAPGENQPSDQLEDNEVSVMALDIQGHRGARGLLPENTIPGFLHALELGVTTLEMDVVISKDGQVVLSHEPWFSHYICTKPDGSPVTEEEEKSLNLYQLTYTEIRQFDCGMRGNARFPNQKSMPVHKPTLNQVIEAAEGYVQETGRPEVAYNIETKSQPARDNIFHPPPDTFAQLLIDVITEQGITERATLQSFDVRTLQVAHEVAPDLQLALLVESHDERNMQEFLDYLGFIPSIYSPYYRLVDQSVVEMAHDKGMQIIPWTINTLDEMQAIKELGVDGIITDYPDIGMQLLDK